MPERPPFVIEKNAHMYRVALYEPEGLCALDLKQALEKQYDIPVDQSVLIVDGEQAPNDTSLTECGGCSWIVMVHVPKAVHKEEAENVALPEAIGLRTPGGSSEFVVTFFYHGTVKPLTVSTDATVGDTIESVIAPAFEVKHPSRLGIFLERVLLPKDALIGEFVDELRGDLLVPVVDNLIATRARDHPLPEKPFRSDCETCMTTDVDCKPRPFCVHCKGAFVVDVLPSMYDVRFNPTKFTWKALESLTGRCQNPNCKGYDTIVDVYFHCICDNRLRGNVPCPSSKAGKPLASYKGGRIETLLEDLFRNQYFVREGIDEEKKEVEEIEGAADGGAKEI